MEKNVILDFLKEKASNQKKSAVPLSPSLEEMIASFPKKSEVDNALRSVPLSSLIHHQIQDDTYLSVQTYDDQFHPISTPYGIISYVNHYFAILEVDLNAIASFLNMPLSSIVELSLEIPVYDSTGSNEVEVYDDDGIFVSHESVDNGILHVPYFSQGDNQNSTCLLFASNTNNGIILFDISDIIIHVYTTPPTLTSIDILSYPNETRYLDGSSFSRTGLRILAHYENNTTREVNSFTCSPSVVTSSNKTITISYTEGNVTKTLSFPVQIYSVDEGYYGKKYLGDFLLSNQPRILLPKCSIQYDFFSLSIGYGSQEVGVTLSYIGDMSYQLSMLNKGLPKRFMFSCQQHLLLDQGIYKYLDDKGNVISFQAIMNKENQYGDIHSLGLTLTISSQEKVIEDLNGDKMYFDGEGKLIATSSSLFPNNRKIYEYDEQGRIEIIYDDRDVNQCIEIAYDSNRIVISSIHDEDLLRTYTLYLSFDRIVRIEESVSTHTKTIFQISYDESLSMISRIEEENGDVIKLENRYDSFLFYITSKISKGVLEGGSFFALKEKSIGYQLSSFDFQTIVDIYIKDENNLYITYQLDLLGRVVSQFEGRRNVSFKSLEKRKGASISYTSSQGSVSSINPSTIDGYLRGLTTNGSFSVSTSNIAEGYQVLSFYVYHATNAERLVLKLSISNVVVSYQDLNPKAYECWQRVDISFYNSNTGQQILTCTFLQGETPIDVLYCGLKVFEREDVILYCSNIPPLEFRNLTTIDLKNNQDQTILSFQNRIDINNYMSENDYLLTWKRYCLLGRNNGLEVFLCNGKKRIYVNGDVIGSTGIWNGSLFSGFTISSYTLDFHLQYKKTVEGYTLTRDVSYGYSQGNYIKTTMITLSNENENVYQKSNVEIFDTHFQLIRRTEEDGKEETITRFSNGEIQRRWFTDGEKEWVLEENTIDSKERISSTSRYGSQSFQYFAGYNLLKKSTSHDYNPNTGSYTNDGLTKNYLYDDYQEKRASITFKQNDSNIGTNSFTYDNNEITLTNQNVSYLIRREDCGDIIKVYLGNDLLLERNKEGLEEEIVYHNDTIYTDTITYDKYGRILSTPYLTYHYLSSDCSPFTQDIDYIEDSSIGKAIHMSYSNEENVGYQVTNQNNQILFVVHKSGNIISYTFASNDIYVREEKEDSTKYTQAITYLGKQSYQYARDSFSRISSKSSSNSYYSYQYKTIGTQTFSLIDSISYYDVGTSHPIQINTQYEYDGKGNISKEEVTCSCSSLSDNPHLNYYVKKEYEYDTLSRLTQVKKDNVIIYSYTYDNIGRLSYISHNGTNRNLTYDAKGRLSTSVVNGSESFSNSFSYLYDAFGNRKQKVLYYSSQPIESYYYERGNLLSQIKDGNNVTIATYQYDGFHRRYSKTVNGITHTYYYDNERLIGEDLSDSRKLRYFYDKEGVCGFLYYKEGNWNSYTYIRNLQGDILYIKDNSETAIVKYEYTPYGEVSVILLDATKEEIAAINPFLYRGYYYDRESSLYYLIHRYYDPKEGIFLTLDDISMLEKEDITGLNLYCYCRYNPVMYADPDGGSAILIGLLIALGRVAIQAMIGAVEYAIWDMLNLIDTENGIHIKNSYLVPSRISRLVFLGLMNANPKYHDAFETSERSFWSYMLEWELHNLASYVLLQIKSWIYNPDFNYWNLESNKIIDELFYHASSVDMEPDKDWLENMWEK